MNKAVKSTLKRALAGLMTLAMVATTAYVTPVTALADGDDEEEQRDEGFSVEATALTIDNSAVTGSVTSDENTYFSFNVSTADWYCVNFTSTDAISSDEESETSYSEGNVRIRDADGEEVSNGRISSDEGTCSTYAYLEAGDYYIEVNYDDGHSGAFTIAVVSGAFWDAAASHNIFYDVYGQYNQSLTLNIINGTYSLSNVTYQWKSKSADQDDIEEISGATESTYTISAVTAVAYYEVEIKKSSSTEGEEEEESAYVGFNVYVDNSFEAYTYKEEWSEEEDDVITVKGTDCDRDVAINGNLVLDVYASAATGDITYVWTSWDGETTGDDGEEQWTSLTADDTIAGGSSEYDDADTPTSTYTIKSATTSIHTRYRCVVTDIFGNETTIEFKINLVNNLEASIEELEGSHTEGDTVTLKVVATCADGNIHYAWYKGDPWDEENRNEEEALSTTDTCEVTLEAGGNQYYCRVTDDYGNETTVSTSIDASEKTYGITVDWIESVSDVTCSVGSTRTFSIVATTTGGDITYQWYVKEYNDEEEETWTLISGATSSTYTPDTKTSGNYDYKCVLTSSNPDSEYEPYTEEVGCYIYVNYGLTVSNYYELNKDEEHPYYVLTEGSDETTSETIHIVSFSTNITADDSSTSITQTTSKLTYNVGYCALNADVNNSDNWSSNESVTLSFVEGGFYEEADGEIAAGTYAEIVKLTVSKCGYYNVYVSDGTCNELTIIVVYGVGYTGEECGEDNHGDLSEAVVEIEATCTTLGFQHQICGICGKWIYKDTPMLDHDYASVVTEPTCTEGGYTTYTCTVCGDSYVDNQTEATGHSYESTVVDATCLEQGYTEHVCTKCGDSYESYTEEDAATGHTAASSWTTTKAATCAATGTKVKYCTTCGDVVETATIAKTSSHSYGSWKTTTAATALKTGVKTRTCSVCGKKETKTISKLTATITVNATTITLKCKQSTTGLVVSGLASGDYVKSYKSSNTKIFTVNSKGKITAKSKTGSAKLTITLASGKTKTITIKVQKSTVKTTKITLSSTKVSIKKGKTYKLASLVTLTPFTSGQKITYTSSNTKIATVNSSGKVTAKKKGTCYITIKSGSKSKKVKITVK